MTCPICHHTNIPTLTTNCPQCDTYLISLKMLNALEEQYVENLKIKVNLEGHVLQKKKDYEKRLIKKNNQINSLWFLLFLLPIGFCFYKKMNPKKILPPLIVQNDSLSIYQTTVIEKETEIMELNRKLKTIEGTKVVRELSYVIKKGDILNDLAKIFYNDSTAWYQIAIDNKIFDVRGLPIGDTLIIKYRE